MFTITKHEKYANLPIRERILINIRDQPGITFTKLVRSLSINEGTLRYHLRYLEKKELVNSKKEGKKRRYFTQTLDVTSRNRKIPLEQKRILNMIRKNEGISKDEIYNLSDISKTKINNILRKFLNGKLIWEIETGNGSGYVYTDKKRLVHEIKIDLIEDLFNGTIDQATFLTLIKKLDSMSEQEIRNLDRE